MILASFFGGAPGRDTHSEVKVLCAPDRGSASWTARISIARWNLMEAAGKPVGPTNRNRM